MTERGWEWKETLLGFLYPNACQLCGEERASAAEGYVGAACRGRPGGIRPVAPPFCERCGLPFCGESEVTFTCGNCGGVALGFSSARAAVVATDMILDLIHRYKYHRALWFEPFLAGLLVERAAAQIQQEGWNLLVPVPLHPLRQREREFNQAERLARRLSRATGIPLNGSALRRVQATPTQTRLGRGERAANVRGVFALGTREGLRGRRVVLVDDVLTTGATTSACAQELRKAGVADVSVWTVARGV